MTDREHAGGVPPRERLRVEVEGIVQGVGFRPFVYAQAARHGLAGFVANDARGVIVEAEGDPTALARFVEQLSREILKPVAPYGRPKPVVMA